MMHKITVARTNVWVCNILVNSQWFGFNPFAIFIVKALLCNLSDVDFWVKIRRESFVVVSCIAINNVEILYLIEVMFSRISRKYA